MCVLCLEELVAALVAPEVALADREAPVEVTAERVDPVALAPAVVTAERGDPAALVALAVIPEEWVAPEGRWEDPEGPAQVVMVAPAAPVTISCTIVARYPMD
jgi:hypothetical protein